MNWARAEYIAPRSAKLKPLRAASSARAEMAAISGETLLGPQGRVVLATGIAAGWVVVGAGEAAVVVEGGAAWAGSDLAIGCCWTTGWCSAIGCGQQLVGARLGDRFWLGDRLLRGNCLMLGDCVRDWLWFNDWGTLCNRFSGGLRRGNWLQSGDWLRFRD